MNRNSSLLLLTFATYHIGDTKQLCKYSSLSRPTCTEAVSELCGMGYVSLIGPTDPRFVNNKNTYAITKLGAQMLCAVASSANDYTNLPITDLHTGKFVAPSDSRSFVAPVNSINPEEADIRRKNKYIQQVLTLEELLLPFGYKTEDVEELKKLPHITVDYARKFVKSGMQPDQAVSFMIKQWKPPSFDLNELEEIGT